MMKILSRLKRFFCNHKNMSWDLLSLGTEIVFIEFKGKPVLKTNYVGMFNTTCKRCEKICVQYRSWASRESYEQVDLDPNTGSSFEEAWEKAKNYQGE